jgi:hypothetical protein
MLKSQMRRELATGCKETSRGRVNMMTRRTLKVVWM